jgi:hypothetical protein
MKIVVWLTAAGVVLAASGAAYAESNDFIMDTSGIGQSHNGVVNSEQLLELGSDSANALTLEGESALHAGHIDRALTVLQRSIEMAPGDIDGRILYAQALEQKLTAEKVRDPALHNFCIKQWFFVFKKSEFPDQMIQARAHLVNLTGVAPRRWDNEQKYLAKVALPETGSESTNVAMKDKKSGTYQRVATSHLDEEESESDK